MKKQQKKRNKEYVPKYKSSGTTGLFDKREAVNLMSMIGKSVRGIIVSD